MLRIIAIFAVLAGSSTTIASSEPDVFAYLSGDWGNSSGNTCVSNPHVITVSHDRSRVTFTYKTPPLESGEYRTLAIERRSPEVSTSTTIDFQVLDHGDNWVALRRVGETELDRLAKKRAWKLTLSKDNMGYRWWLYNSVAGKKSLLRGERCQSDEYARNQAIDRFSLERVDPVLRDLVGDWESDAFEKGKLIRYSAEGKAVLQGTYVHVLIKELTPSPHYEASIYIGQAAGENEYTAHWLDSFGVDSARVNGTGTLEDDVLNIRFPSADNSSVNVFRFRMDGLFRGAEFELIFSHRNPDSGAIEEDATYRFKRPK